MESYVASADCESMFEWAPISLWLEDYSELKNLFDAWRKQGVVDIRAHLQAAPERLLECSRKIRLVRVNRQTLILCAAQSQEELVARLSDIFRDDMLESFVTELENLWSGVFHFTKETVNYALDGRRIEAQIHVRVLPGHEESWSRVMVTLEDITIRKKIAANLEYVSTHDSLTGLYNRAFYTSELERIARQGTWPLCVVVMDLNGLKRINDAQGHAAGDAVLRRVGDLLRRAHAMSHPACSMVRIGGDEFAALMPGCNELLAQALIDCITKLVSESNLHDPEYLISLSIGMATCSAAGDIDESLHLADQRMFAEKNRFYAAAPIERRIV